MLFFKNINLILNDGREFCIDLRLSSISVIQTRVYLKKKEGATLIEGKF